MIPLKDNIRTRRVPLLNYSLILVCTLVFFQQLRESRRGEGLLVERYGMIPARVVHPGKPIYVTEQRQVRFFGSWPVRRELEAPPLSPWITLLTCIFLHGGWMHFVGNMWFLYIFGDNIEDRLGHLGYLLFFLGTGVAASAVHLLSDPSSTVPTIGASGAIAGVMGAYFLLFPRAKVITLVPIFIFLHIMVIPAPVFLGLWFVLQFLQGTFSITAMQTGGVAWWAHIGGFVAGLAVVVALLSLGALERRVVEIIPVKTRRVHYR